MEKLISKLTEKVEAYRKELNDFEKAVCQRGYAVFGYPEGQQKTVRLATAEEMLAIVQAYAKEQKEKA